MSQYQIAVIVGSLRKDSFNRKLASAIVKLAPPEFSFKQVQIGDLPLYNQDDDANQAESVKRMKGEIAASAGHTVCYARIQPFDPRRAQERDRPCLAALWPERLGRQAGRSAGYFAWRSRYRHGTTAFAQYSRGRRRTDTSPNPKHSSRQRKDCLTRTATSAQAARSSCRTGWTSMSPG